MKNRQPFVAKVDDFFHLQRREGENFPLSFPPKIVRRLMDFIKSDTLTAYVARFTCRQWRDSSPLMNDAENPLDFAAKREDIELVKWLLKREFSIKRANTFNFIARWKNHRESHSILIEHNAEYIEKWIIFGAIKSQNYLLLNSFIEPFLNNCNMDQFEAVLFYTTIIKDEKEAFEMARFILVEYEKLQKPKKTTSSEEETHLSSKRYSNICPIWNGHFKFLQFLSDMGYNCGPYFYKSFFENILIIKDESRVISSLEWLMKHQPIYLKEKTDHIDDLLPKLAGKGFFRALQWIQTHANAQWNWSKIFHSATIKKRMEIMEWAWPNVFLDDVSKLVFEIRGKNFSKVNRVVEWLYQRGINQPFEVIFCSLCAGNIKLADLTWNRTPNITNLFKEYLVERNAVIEEVVDTFFQLMSHDAASSENIESIKWVLSKCPNKRLALMIKNWVMQWTVSNQIRSQDFFDELLDIGCVFPGNIISEYVSERDIDFLRYLRSRGAKWTGKEYNDGHYIQSTFQWLNQEGCPRLYDDCDYY